MKKTVSGIMLTLLLVGMLTLAFNIQPVKAGGTIYIRADGSIDPPTAPIQRDGDVYTFTDNIYDEIVVERDNIVIDGNGYTLQGSGTGTGIYLSGRTNVTVRNTQIKTFYYGIWLGFSSNNSISGNNIANNYDGIWLYPSCNYNSISGNNIANNVYGIWLYSSCNYNSISGNNIANDVYGIGLGFSSNNSISGNNIANEGYGIRLYYSSGNMIYHNNFSSQQVVTQDSSDNLWDDGYPSGGNYWSDYVGVDIKSGPGQNLPESDGIGDTPYVIDSDNVDHYPLMNPYGAPPPQTYSLTITATVGGTTNPAPETYSYTANSSVQVTAIPEANYLFDYWELDSVNVGSVNPYTVLMDINHTLKAFFSPIPPALSVSINPLSASITVGQSVTFTSTVSGEYTPYSYQWYLNGNPVSGATLSNWTFTPSTSGIYYVYLKVTDSKSNMAQSETARITVATVPVGGYSFPIGGYTTAKPITPYLALIAILTIGFTAIKRKTQRRTKHS